MARILKNKKPKTKFIDEEKSIKVTLISHPDVKMTEKLIVNTVYGYKEPNIYNKLTLKERKQAIQNAVDENILPKTFEMTGKFVFLIENISLTITHCLVRHRFFTILQQSTAVEDLRNENFVMPKSFARNKKFYNEIKDWYLEGKRLFCEAVDKHGISVQNARLLIPKNNCNHMFIGCDLLSLKAAYGQRSCTQEEPIQNNIIFNKMKSLVVELFPYLDKYFKSDCMTGKCLHTRSGKHSNVVFKRDELHSSFVKDKKIKDDTLHDETRDYMNRGKHIKKEMYI